MKFTKATGSCKGSSVTKKNEKKKENPVSYYHGTT